MEFVKKNGKMELNGEVLKTSFEKSSGKRWWHIPASVIPVLNRQLIGMKQEEFDKAEEGHIWDIPPKKELVVRNMAGGPKKEKSTLEHWSNYLSETDKKLYDELEKKGQETRKAAYEKNSKQRQIEELQKKIEALQAELKAQA